VKKLLAILVASLACTNAGAGCVVLDYQEMKEMKSEDLVAELCKARSSAKQYRTDADDSTVYGSKLSGYGSDAEVDEAYKKGDSLRELSKACTDQASRMERILTAAGIGADTIKQSCATSK